MAFHGLAERCASAAQRNGVLAVLIFDQRAKNVNQANDAGHFIM